MDALEELEKLKEEGVPDLSEQQIDEMIKEAWEEEDIQELEDAIAEAENRDKEEEVKAIVRKLAYIDISLIDPNPEQPRIVLFEDDKELRDMVESIKAHGDVKRPIIVVPFGGRFILKDGQRRFEASKGVGVKKIYSIIEYEVGESGPVSVPRSKLLEDAIITNEHQRKMSPAESALAYARWLELTGLTQADLATQIGRKSSDIAVTLKLLKLDESILADLAVGKMPRALGQHLASYPKDRQQEIREEYNRVLDSLGGKIPSSNALEWVAKTLRGIAEKKGVEPLKPKRGKKMKPFAEMVFTSIKRATKRFNNLLDELDDVSRSDKVIQRKEALEIISNLRYLAENIEDSCLKLEGRLDR